MTPTFELRRDFCTMHLSPQFHHRMFTRSEVIVLTNKQTDASENIQCSSLRYDVTGTENILLPDMISKLFESWAPIFQWEGHVTRHNICILYFLYIILPYVDTHRLLIRARLLHRWLTLFAVITQHRSIAKNGGCFASICLLVCLCVYQHVNFRTSKHRMMKFGGRCTAQKPRPSSNSGWQPSPRYANPQNLLFWWIMTHDAKTKQSDAVRRNIASDASDV